MDRSSICTLIAETQTKDSIGQYVATETTKEVYCSIQSVSSSEFFSAGQIGLNPQYKLTVFKYDYSGEKIVELDGTRYAVYRTYEAQNDIIELYLELQGGVTHGQ